ncbi:hypothetical protein M378DRAFT_171802 [Amanita muscaria Koide BX008]|uniref:Uncharacterized protein n=1 Tax=Amanita muscaria (strain Koide BX008) TaxID=946122 RepID=A0A0C2S3X1_AMAMK|nr:hypothetical protein M378DRAFT_171802 [Amanita muscaria Koide BX008]
MSSTLKGVRTESSRKRPPGDNDDYREKRPKVRIMGPENNKLPQAGWKARTRRNASTTDKDIDTLTNGDSMLKKTLIFSHIDVPRASWWPAAGTEAAATTTPEDHPKPSPTLPEYYGPSIGPLSLFLARCHDAQSATIDGLCQVLSFFGIFVYRGMLICTLHRRGLDIIPLSLLPVHLDRRHKNSLQRGTDSERMLVKKNAEIYSDIVQHVSKCCGISPLQSLEDVVGTEEVSDLLRPHPDVSSQTQEKMVEPVGEVHAEQRCFCPVTTCQELVAINKGKGSGRAELIRHITECHPLDSKAKKTARSGAVTTRWIQKVAVVTSGQGGSRFKFLLLPVGWETTQTSQSVIPTEPYSSAAKFFDATWTTKTRWNQCRAAFEGVSPKILSELVAAPAMALIPQKLGTKSRAIELGLYNLKRVVYVYLLEFREILATIPGVRDIIAMKLVVRYKVSSKLSYYKPCAILVSTIALMMRYRLYRTLSGKSEYLGNFELACTLEQERTSKELYDLLISSNGEPSSMAELQKKFHALCVALITSCRSTDSCLACPTDQVLFIHGLESHLGWKSPVGVYSRCGHLQIAFQAIFIQMARLSATPSRDYQPYDCEPFDFGDDIDLSDDFDDDGLEDENEAENPQETIQSAQSPTSSILQTILSFSRDHISLLDPQTSEGVMSPFSQLKTISSILFASVQTANPENTTVTNVGRSIQVSFPNGYSSSLDLNAWSHGTIIALSEYQHAVAALCPSSFSPKTFTHHQLRDDFGRAALFKQEHNAKWLDPLRDSVWKELLQNQKFVCAGKVQVEACQQWLEKEQAVLRTLAVVFALTCGVCPPQHGFRVRFDTQYPGPEIRDLWLIDPGQVIWVQNRSRPWQNGHFTPAVFCLPTAATSLVMLYLCIFRPISCQVLSLLSRDTTLHSHEIWSHFRYQLDKPYYWNGPDIAQPILKHTKDTMDRAYSPAEIRLLVGPILHRYFSDSILYNMAAIIDPAAQHTNETSLNHYGRISAFPYIPHLQFYHTEQSIAFSRVWHSLLGLGPIEEGLVVGDDTIRVLFSHHGFIGGGLLHSRHAVKVYGDLSDKGLVEDLVRKQPFASGSSVHFGDPVLLNITCCIMQDMRDEALLDDACFTEHVVTAICLILRALNERATGQFMDLERLDVDSLVHYSRFRNHFAEVVTKFKETYLDGWKAFIRAVIRMRS